MTRVIVIRLLVLASVITGINYVVWRWAFSLNLDAWWIAVPLVIAETYSLIDSALFGMTVWKARRRAAPPAAPAGLTVDVFIATYNEPIELVTQTAEGAKAIRYPHRTWILDDGSRPGLREAAASLNIGYISRGAEWEGFSRHAKAGNVNNALLETEGEFVLILDADMVPHPQILDRTLGYFDDPSVAFVQTPQHFLNVSHGDPLGSQAPLFYGPIQEGKDGWNAAFFCGSNAVLRRDALMQLGITGYVKEVEGAVRVALNDAARIVRRARARAGAVDPRVQSALAEVSAAIAEARDAFRAGSAIADVTYILRSRVDAAAQSIVAADLADVEAELAAIDALAHRGRHAMPPEPRTSSSETSAKALAAFGASPLHSLDDVRQAIDRVAVDRPGEAQPIMPLSTSSVTEDLATSMQLHALGWRSVFHHENLADGLALRTSSPRSRSAFAGDRAPCRSCSSRIPWSCAG